MQATFFFLSAIILTIFLTLGVKKIAMRLNVLDYPKTGEVERRKIHKKPTPLLGGVAVFFGFFALAFLAWRLSPLLFTHLLPRQMLAFFGGAAILMAGGYLDDKYNLKPREQLVFPILATAAVIGGGVNLKEVTNPFGGTVNLAFWRIGGHLVLVDILVFLWLLGMMYTTKILDGLDGLVTGIAAIGGLMIFLLASLPKFYQPDVALVALIFAGVNLGFLVFNFHPAKIFLGEGGSLFAGFVLGFLAIAAGGKIATTLLVVALPAVDLLFVIFGRLRRRQSPFTGGSDHLHYHFLQWGFSQRQTVLFFYFAAFIFGILTLFLQSKQKFIVLIFLAIAAAGLVNLFSKKFKKDV